MADSYKFQVDKSSEKKRLDVYLAEILPHMSRTYIKKGINSGWITVNSKQSKANYKIKESDIINIEMPTPEKQLPLKAENIPLNILYEDEDIIIINKKRGMIVYPAPGNSSGTVANALLYHTKKLSEWGGSNRPGIVHRLDKDTSGLLIVAKNDSVHKNLVEQLKNREVKKTYIALVFGTVREDSGIIDAPIGRNPVNRTKMSVTTQNSRHAITYFKVLERFSDYTLLEIDIETGRTHQIRVHMEFIGHPLVGDPIYSDRKNPFPIKGQALHAYKLGFKHPKTCEYIEFKASLPEDISKILNILRKGNNNVRKKNQYNG